MRIPDRALTAGGSYGYLFHFTEPFETFKGKELGINAYHKETEEKTTAVLHFILMIELMGARVEQTWSCRCGSSYCVKEE